MVDFTEINFDVIPEVSLLHTENIVLKKSNKLLNNILLSLGAIVIVSGIYYLTQIKKNDYE